MGHKSRVSKCVSECPYDGERENIRWSLTKIKHFISYKVKI